MEELELFVYCWWEGKVTQPLWKILRTSSKKTQNYHCCSVDESCPTFCDPQELQHARLPRPSLSSWDCSNLRSLIELVMPSNHLILCRSLLLPSQSFPAPGSFLMSQFSHQVAKVTPLLHIYPQSWKQVLKYLYMDVCNSTIHKCANNEDICQTPNGQTKCSITPKEESSTFGTDRYTVLYLK